MLLERMMWEGSAPRSKAALISFLLAQSNRPPNLVMSWIRGEHELAFIAK